MAEMESIGELCQLINGYAFKSSDWSSEGIPIVRIQNLNNILGKFNYFKGKLDKKYYIDNGALLFSWSGTLGAFIWNRGPAVINQHIFRVIPKKRINIFYLKYALNGKLSDIIAKSHGGVGLQHITKKDFEKINISVPSLDVQNKIVMTLNSLEDILEKRKQQLSKLDQLIKSRFIEMFGDPVTNPKAWAIVKLKSISQKISDGVHAKPIYTTEGKPFISVVNITRGFVDFTNCKYVSEEAYAQMIRSTHPEKGDILYTKVGATYGIPAYIDTDKEFCLYVSVCLIKPLHDKVNAKFLSHSMAMPYIKRQADQRIKGIGVPDLHLNQIREFDILLPPVALQNRFVAFVEQLDKSKFTIRKSLEQLETLYRALLQEYFG